MDWMWGERREMSGMTPRFWAWVKGKLQLSPERGRSWIGDNLYVPPLGTKSHLSALRHNEVLEVNEDIKNQLWESYVIRMVLR